ncbi:MAG: DUF11 domain-containing protein [Candidatus Altiarchaeota archaeon]|nr:DUF11 domain-containing protein [Candidatus Altiarchaeota archaeon]
MLISALAAAQECSTELQNSGKRMHAVMESCKNTGTFSLGGIYDGSWEKLTYFHPKPWGGTFISIRVDDAIYVNSLDPVEGIRMDEYVTAPPAITGDAISVKWMLPEQVSVEEILEIVEDSTLIHLKIKNENPEKNVKVGARLHIDTMLGDNDGAPIYVPGDGLKETEKEYSGKDLSFKYWKAYNRINEPDIIATGILNGKLTYPDKLVIANWKKSTRTSWSYTADGETSILGDSAVMLYYEPALLYSGKTREIITGYGSGEPVLKKISEITEMVLDNITGEYCGGRNVEIKADVGSRTEFSGYVELGIKNRDGQLQYNRTIPTGTIDAESVKSVRFVYRIPENASFDEYEAKASLYNDKGELIDEKSTKFTVNATKCGVIFEERREPNWLLILFLFFIVLATAAAFILTRRRGGVVVDKTKEGERVTVSVYNNSANELKKCVMEDRIPEGAEVDTSTIHVKRRGTKLTLNIGTLKAGERAALEYRIKNVNMVPKALFRWDGGEKMSE